MVYTKPRNCTTDDIREVLGKYKRESAAKAGQILGFPWKMYENVGVVGDRISIDLID